MGLKVFALVALCACSLAGASKGQKGTNQTVDQQASASEPLDIVVVGRRRTRSGPSPKTPPRCVRRPGDPVDLVRVRGGRTDQRVIAPDRKGVLKWQSDREEVSGPETWQRAGNGIGQYVFRVPENGDQMCIGAAVTSPSGWGQLRQIVKTTPAMIGRYLHFSAIVAARDAEEIRFWLAAGGYGGRVMGGDTHRDPLHGTFGWQQLDVIVGPVPYGADHVSYGFLLWGKGDVWLSDPQLDIQTREQVRKIPSLPITLQREQADLR